MTDGPGPKEPPFIQRALAAVEAAISEPAATLTDVLAKAHEVERAALDAAHKRETEAATAIMNLAANAEEHLKVLAARFPDVAEHVRSALSCL